MDRVSSSSRSKLMSRIKAKNTKPEIIVRKALFSRGYRYRLHGQELPGKPDLVFPGKKKVIFVHGCFWHGHDCKKGKRPKSNTSFWDNKLDRNIDRDASNIKKLLAAGWSAYVVWECQLQNVDDVIDQLVDFLG